MDRRILFPSFTVPVLLLATACGGKPAPAQETPGEQPVHVRVLWLDDPQHTAVVSWSTAVETGRNELHLDSEPRDGEAERYARSIPATRSGKFSARTGGDPELWFHHAHVDGLAPSTTYWFVARSEDATSREMHFLTAPADDRPVTILSGGDSRSDREQRRTMNRLIASLVEKDPDILALAHGGDYVWDGFDLGLFAVWLEDHELTVTEAGRALPLVPTRGNHEGGGDVFDEVFCWPGGGFGRNYYALSFSPEVLLITLNTEIAAGGDQTQFLERTLIAAADVRWKAAQYHRPLWPAVKKDASAKPHWLPLFEEHGLDIAFESDGHVLKRTVPIRDGEENADGVVYVGEGGLGVKQRRPDADRWYLQEPGHASSAYHVWKVRFGHDAVELTAIGEDGATLDSASVPARPRED